MEITLSILSLIWVMGILTLQRLDSIIREYIRTATYATSLREDGVDIEDVTNKSFWNTSISLLFIAMQEKKSTKDYIVSRAKKTRTFVKRANRVKTIYEIQLLIATVLLPLMQAMNFAGIPAADWLTKNDVLLFTLIIIALQSFIFEKYLMWLSRNLGTIDFMATNRDRNP